jgi:hypothetical protein
LPRSQNWPSPNQTSSEIENLTDIPSVVQRRTKLCVPGPGEGVQRSGCVRCAVHARAPYETSITALLRTKFLTPWFLSILGGGFCVRRCWREQTDSVRPREFRNVHSLICSPDQIFWCCESVGFRVRDPYAGSYFNYTPKGGNASTIFRIRSAEADASAAEKLGSITQNSSPPIR